MTGSRAGAVSPFPLFALRPRGPTKHFQLNYAVTRFSGDNSQPRELLLVSADRIAGGYCVMKFDTSTELNKVIVIFKVPDE